MKRIFILGLALIMVIICFVGCSSGGSKGFSSPEEAVETFFKYAKNQDLNGMLSCCSTDPYIDHMTFEKTVGYMRNYGMTMDTAPTEYDLYRQIVRQKWEGKLAGQIQNMVYSLVMDTEEMSGYFESQPIILGEDAAQWAEKFVEDSNPEKLKSLEVLSIDVYNIKEQKTRYNEEHSNKLYAADGECERVALIKVDGKLFTKGFTLLEYDGKWYIHYMSSSLLGESSFGTATEITESEYKEMLLG